MKLHEAAARGFQRGARDYERARPTYPAAAVQLLVQHLLLRPGRRVVDLGAGTGKLTRLLLPTEAAIVAVEPVAAMRAVLQQAVPGVEIRAGTAEALPVGDGEVDVVVVGQAFHWFDPHAAVAELSRVTRPGGGVGLVWNVRDDSVPWVAELDALIERHAGDAPRYRDGTWRVGFEASDAFSPLRHAAVRSDQPSSPDLLAARVASISYVAALGDDVREPFLDEVRALGRRQGERFVVPHRTDVYWCTRS